MRSFVLTLVLTIALGAPDRARAQEAAASQPATDAAAGRRADLRRLADELPKRHVNLFAKLTREDWQSAVAELDRRAESLSDERFRVELARLVARVGDAHTLVLHTGPQRTLPLAFYWFSDGLFVVSAAKPYSHLLKSRVVRIGRANADEALTAVSALFAYDNESARRNRAPQLLTSAETLAALGLVDSAERVPIRVATAAGEQDAELIPLPPGARAMFETVKPDAIPAYRRRTSDVYWFDFLADSQTLYFAYNSCVEKPSLPFARFVELLFTKIDETNAQRLFIDLRNNGGGNSALLAPLIERLKDHPLNQRGRLFVGIGRRTFSSAQLNADELKERTRALLVGEPTGGKPNHFGEVRTFQLDHCKMMVQHSTKYFRRVEGDPETTRPDLPAETSSADFFAGRDPVLEAAVKYASE